MANSPARAAVDVGSVIADTYKIEALLGRGGMGAVFLASHRRLAGKHVAIKILHLEIEDADIVARFKREAEIAARLNHPNIVGVIDYNVAPDGMPYLVLDYLEGETLAQRIARGPLALDQVVSILRQVGSALAAAHRAGIVHRDLKPQNIFLVPTEVDGRIVEIAKVLDFGISKIRGSQTVKTQDSALLGTPQYMAPEQAMGQHDQVDDRTDVFALGAIVYEMLSGQPAFSGASIPEVVFKVVYEQPAPLDERAPSAPPAVVSAVARAMAKPSAERFATVTAFVEAVTGQPLTLSRGLSAAAPAAAESPSALRRVSTGEAFANTMGSGDHGDSPIAATAASPAAAPAATVPGAPHRPIALPQVAPTFAVPAAERTTAAPRRRTAAILAVAIAGAAAVGVAMFFAMQRTPSPEPSRDPASHRDETRTVADRGPDPRPRQPEALSPAAAAQAAPGAAPVAGTAPVAAAAAPVDPPAGQPTADHKLADERISDPAADRVAALEPRPAATAKSPGLSERAGKRPGAAKPAVHAPPPPPADGDAEGDADIRDRLKQAAAALDARDYDLAERVANAVINSSQAGPKQRATARLIHGTVQCAARNDQEAAQIDLRNLDGFRGLRGRLLTVCRSHGILTAQ